MLVPLTLWREGLQEGLYSVGAEFVQRPSTLPLSPGRMLRTVFRGHILKLNSY